MAKPDNFMTSWHFSIVKLSLFLFLDLIKQLFYFFFCRQCRKPASFCDTECRNSICIEHDFFQFHFVKIKHIFFSCKTVKESSMTTLYQVFSLKTLMISSRRAASSPREAPNAKSIVLKIVFLIFPQDNKLL